ncbi:unnamed protein product [Closterium sp. NIES-53]
MYLMTCTRPDLAYPLSILARYVAPGRHRPEHMAAAKRVLRYLCSTSGLGLVLGGRRPVVLTGHADASWAEDQATQRSSQGYTFSLGSGSVLWRSTRSSSVLGSSCEAEIHAGAMAAQEFRWLTYLLTDLGEPPRSPPVLYVDNKAMLALCREHRLQDRTKHIALRYFLARELQQRGQLHLSYVASEANTADIFTKALPPGDHQRFCTMLGLLALLCLTSLPTPLSTSRSLSAPPSEESVEPSGPYPELVGCLMYLMTRTRPDLAYPLSLLARYVSPVHRAWGSCLEDGLELSSLVTLTPPGSSCEAEIYAGAMAAQELRWLTYLLFDLGEQPRSPPQRGQLRLTYVATRANTADIFTKALLPDDHQRFSTVLGLEGRCFTAVKCGNSFHRDAMIEVFAAGDRFQLWSLFWRWRFLDSRRAALAAPRAAPTGPLAAHAARDPPVQHCAPPLAALLPPLGPRAAPRPASRPSCSLRAATCSPLAAPCCCLPCYWRCPAPARLACCAAMASLRILAFDREGRPIQFDTWLDDLQLYLLSDSRDGVSLFDHTYGASLAPPETADSATCSQWLNRVATARLAIRNHLPLAECTHFRQHRTAQALYDAIVARYSSPATAALGRLLLPYLFPELSAFATVEDLVTQLCTSDARYRAALPGTRPRFLTFDLLEQHLLADETSVVAIGAARGTPRTPFFEGCSPSPLAPSYASAAAVDVLGAEDVRDASASGKRRSSKRKGGRGGGGGSGGGGGGSSGGGGGSGSGGSGGSGGGSGGFGGGGGGSNGGGEAAAAASKRDPVALKLREWFSQRGPSGGSVSCPYVIRMGDRAGQMCGKPHIQHRCFSHLDDACRADFGDEAERPRWAELLRYGVAIFDLYYDAIPAAMYALSVSAEGDCYLCVPPDPGIEAAALGACESALPVIAPGDALHTFTLYSGASRYFFRDITTLTHLSAPVPVRLADPSGGPVLACSSTVFPCSAVLSGSLSGLHLPSFSMNLVSTAALQDGHYHHSWGSACVDLHVYTDGSSPCHVHSSASVESVHTGYRASSVSYVCPGVRVRSGSTPLLVSPPDAPDSPGAPPPWSPLPATPSWHALPPPCLWSSQVFASPPALAFPALPSLRRGVAARRSSLLLGRERYFLLVVDDYTRYTTVFPLRSKGQVPNVLIPWILTVRLHLREQFHQDLPDRGGEFSSDLLRDFCRGKGILPSFMLQDSPQKNGISERRIGLVMEFYHLTSCHVFPSHDVMFGESVPFYRLFPYRSAPPPPPPLFLAPAPPPVDPLPPQGPAPSGVSQVDPLPGTAPVKVAVGSGAARGAASGGSAYGGVEPGVAESQGAGSGGAEPGGEERGGAEPVGVEPEGAEPEGVEPGGAESEGAESGGVVPQGAASSGGPAGASPRLSAQHLREWLVRRAHLRSGATGDGGARDAGAGGAGVTAGAGGPGGTSAGGSGGARTRGTGASGTGGVGGAGAGDPTEPGAAGARGARGAGARGPVPPQGDAPSGVSQVDPHLGTVPVEVAVDSSAARGVASGGAASGGVEPRGAKSEGAGSRGAEPRDAEPACAEPAGVEPGGAEPEGVEPRGAEPEGVEPGGAESEGVESGGVEPRGTASSGGSADSSAGDTGARGVGATRLGGAGVTPGAGDTGGAAAAGPRGARTRGTGAAGTGRVGEARAGDPAELGGAGVRGAGAEGTEAGGAGAGGARAGDTAAVGAGAGGAGAGDTRVVVPGAGGVEAGGAVSGDTGAGGTVRPQPYFVPLLQQTGGLTEHRKFESRPVRAVRTGRRVPRPRPPPVPSTHTMALRPSSVPLRVPLLPPPASSLLAIPDPESDLARAASPTVSCLLATFVTDPSFESSAAFSLVAEMVDFVAACGLDNATALVPESESASPPSVGGECALGSDVLEDRQEDFECLAAAVPRFASMLHAPEGDPDARDIPTPRSYTEAITGPYSS